MTKKVIAFIVVVLIIVLTLTFLYSAGDNTSSVKTLYVSTDGPFHLSDLIQDVESASYFEGYDNETLMWMKSLGDKSVFSGDDYFVVMSHYDASKLHSEYLLDAYIIQEFQCNILENHSLGNVKYPRDVLYVENVKYLGENVTDFQGS